jgi:creatinine amidohydrolase
MAQWQTSVDGHAGESETSQIMVIRPDLVDLEQIRADEEGMPRERLAALRQAGIYTGIWWYGDHPTHYRGDARPATAEKGERVLAARARALAAAVRLIKEDGMARSLQDAFFAASSHAMEPVS